ncbi:MAG: hypothetical protein IKS05_06235 [Oscillospiraceae bacterium]|nr:hypothetical protein [Oscillospiraceae bacterium]
METKVKSGHPVLGIVLGLMGIGIALTLTILTGVVGGGVALLLGLAALILGVKASKGGARIGSILVGVVAMLLAAVMTVTSVGAVSLLRDTALKNNPDSLVAKYTDKPYMGFLGMAINVSKSDEDSVEALMAEFQALQDQVASATEAK